MQVCEVSFVGSCGVHVGIAGFLRRVLCSCRILIYFQGGSPHDRHTKFTRTQQKIADYFLNNQERLAGLSSQEAAHEIGVSDASIIRFCRIIGYEGFKDLKAQVFNMLVENSFSGLSLGERMTQSTQKFQQIDPAIQFQSFIYQNMLSVFTNSPEDFDRTTEILISSTHKYIIGLRGCRGIALTFCRTLSFMLPNAYCLNDSEGLSISRMQDVTESKRPYA